MRQLSTNKPFRLLLRFPVSNHTASSRAQCYVRSPSVSSQREGFESLKSGSDQNSPSARCLSACVSMYCTFETQEKRLRKREEFASSHFKVCVRDHATRTCSHACAQARIAERVLFIGTQFSIFYTQEGEREVSRPLEGEDHELLA